jgi:hypothetical protein
MKKNSLAQIIKNGLKYLRNASPTRDIKNQQILIGTNTKEELTDNDGDQLITNYKLIFPGTDTKYEGDDENKNYELVMPELTPKDSDNIPLIFGQSHATNAENYEIKIVTDPGVSNILKDTKLTDLDPEITIPNHTNYFARVRAKNTDKSGQWSYTSANSNNTGLIGNTSKGNLQFSIRGTSDYYHADDHLYKTDLEKIIKYKGTDVLAIQQHKIIDNPENKDPEERILVPGMIVALKYRTDEKFKNSPVTRIKQLNDIVDKCNIRNMLYKEGYHGEILFWGDSDRPSGGSYICAIF